MRDEAIRALAQKTAEASAAHWRDCLKAGLPDHTPDAHAEVDRCVAAYFQRLQMMPDPAEKSNILSAIEALFLELDKVQARYGPQLLETDEREIFVTAIIKAAELAGLDVYEFGHDDPTLKFRNF
ncbi:MAG: hypothetical protein ABUS57_08420 [Pseudomonadota bacterium]